jgi:hypothetical protein
MSQQEEMKKAILVLLLGFLLDAILIPTLAFASPSSFHPKLL